MADINRIIPFILKYETGVVQKAGESVEQLFERARPKGWANDPLDKGGATQSGVTLTTYKTYCKNHKISTPTATNLKNIPFVTWRAILKELYWDKWCADKIVSQSIAEICVDWVWASGKYGITKVQALLGVKADGIAGPKTLAALNAKSPLPFFTAIKNERIKFINNIVLANPSQKKWLKGWTNRINDIKFVS